VTEREFLFLLIGAGLGYMGRWFTVWMRHGVALRAKQAQQREVEAERRAQMLREKLADATGRDNGLADEEAVFAALFSENGYERLIGEDVEEEEESHA
jgi:hypothetical protein